MTVPALLDELSRRNVELIPEGERLRLRAPKGTLTPDLQANIARMKLEILSELTKAVLAKVRGQDRFEQTYEAEICWHCKGLKSCNCALCGHGLPSEWEAGQCGCCHGTGYLTWGRVN